MPLDEQDRGLASSGGKFFKIRDLKPGESITVRLESLVKNYSVSNPKFCIKERDYNYRLSFTDEAGAGRIMDLNSPSAIGEVTRVLVKEGVDVPCNVTLTRRVERKQSEAELQVTGVEAV